MLGIPTLRRVAGELRRDVAAAHDRDPAARGVSSLEVLAAWPGVQALLAHRLAHALKARTRRNVDLWAACVGGAIPRRSYVEAIETTGLRVSEVRRNDYRFISDRAQEACSTYGVESISLVGDKP